MQHSRLSFALACFASGLVLAAPSAWAQFNVSTGKEPVVPLNKVQSVDTIVAVVNNEVITRRELEDRIRMIVRRLNAQQGGNVALPSHDELQRQVLERMIVDLAQLQMAKEMNITVDDLTVDRTLARIAEQNKMSLQDFRNQIEHEGTSFVQFRDELRREIIMQRLREREVANKIQVSESEVENFLASESGQAQPEVNVAQILVRIPENASPEQIEERRKRAEQLMAQLQGGADFAKVATASSDAGDALSGGEIGWRSQDRLPQLFLDAVSKLKPGEVSPIVKSPNGFHILKLIGKRTASVMKSGSSAPAMIQQTHARHILIKVNQVVTPQEAQRKLIDLKQRIEHGAAKFEDLAKSFSNDLSASKGGDLGWIYPGDTVPEFERAMNALAPGQVSEPIETPFGWHLIQVVERKTEDVSQERQRLVARQAIRDRKLEEATQDWLRQVRDRAYVEYRLDEK